ncbi:MAG: hypothetical protein IIC67_00170 [Thaumarchaeota archaeon]|nr:hypothetical protein [Nitrososphaerota archaeon]
MYSIKFSPYNTGNKYEKLSKRKTHVLPADEYSWSVHYPLSHKDFRKVLDEELEHVDWSVIWSMPLEPDEFPEDGLQLVFITVHKSIGIDGASFNQIVNTYVAYDCSVYIMNDLGRTIDRIG